MRDHSSASGSFSSRQGSRTIHAEDAMHVADLDAETATSGNKWRTIVTVSIIDANQAPVAGAKVFGSWSFGGSANCTVDASGRCTLDSDWKNGDQINVMSFTVDDVTHSESLSWAYDPAGNGDPDGDGDGTAISTARPW